MPGKNVFLYAVFIILFSAFSIEMIFAQSAAQLPAQNAAQLPAPNAAQTGASLETEIRNLERAVTRQGIPAAEKHAALVRLAQLRQLTGDIEGAARNWLEAAGAIPGKVDDNALLSCAYCLAAMGEWDRAATALDPLIPKYYRARFLDICIKAIKTNDVSQLISIADNPEYIQMRAEIIFVLWKLSPSASSGRWRQRLITEFPQTPEGRLAAGESPSIVMNPSPFWLFAGGLDSLPLASQPVSQNAAQLPAQSAAQLPAQSAAQPPAQSTSHQQQTTTVTPPQTVNTQPAVQSAARLPVQTTARLQTGVFSRQVNAQTQATNLRNAGFSPSIETRIVNGTEMWAVTVPAGEDQNRTMTALRAAGFDFFLIK